MAKRKAPRGSAKRPAKTPRTPAARLARPKARAAKPAASKAAGKGARAASSSRTRKVSRPKAKGGPKRAPAKLARRPKKLASRPKKKVAIRKRQAAAKKAARKTTRKAAATSTRRSRSPRSSTTSAARTRPRVQPPGPGLSPEELAALVPGTVSSLDLNQRPLEDPPIDDLEAAFRTSGRTDRAIVAGDVDVPVLGAATSGEEAPGGDNPTPDQDVVDLIGRSLGVEYADNEELRPADKIADRDKHRWELDPASAEDYRERTKPR